MSKLFGNGRAAALGFFLAAAAAGSALAGGFQPKTVIDDPAWVLHLDADALRQSFVGKRILEKLDQPESAKGFVFINAMLTFDPRKSLHGLTLYSATTSPADGVALVYADFDAARLISLAESASDHQVVTNKGRAIHNWANEKGDAPRTFAAIYDGKVAVFAQKEKLVITALDVLAGDQPGFKDNGYFPKAEPAGASPILFAVAHKLDVPGTEPHAVIFKQAKHLSMAIAATDAELVGKLSLTTDNEDSAQQVALIAQGLLALLSLSKDNPDAAAFTRALKVKQDGANVEVRLKAAKSDVMEIVNGLMDKGHKDGQGDEDKGKRKDKEKSDKN